MSKQQVMLCARMLVGVSAHILRISTIQPIIVYEIQKKVVKFQRLKIAVQTIYYLGIANRFYAKPSFIQ